jgi:hypothetical protein
MRTATNRFIVLSITIMWLITIPLALLFWIKVIGWSVNLTLLIVLPILGIFLPVSYPLAIEGNERFKKGEGLELSSGILLRSGLLGLLGGTLSCCAIWLYALLSENVYWGIAIVGLVVVLLAYAAAHVFREIVKGIRLGR